MTPNGTVVQGSTKHFEKRRRRAAAFGNVPASDELTLAARKLAIRALTLQKANEYSKLAAAVLEYPTVLGKMAAQRLMNVARNKRFAEKLRVAAIQGLSQLEGEPAVIKFLSQFARPKEKGSLTLKEAACDTLGVLSPLELSRLRSKPAQVAGWLAFRHNSLFFKRTGNRPVIFDQTSTANGKAEARVARRSYFYFSLRIRITQPFWTWMKRCEQFWRRFGRPVS